MIRYARLFCAVILIGACFACAPPLPPIQPTAATCSVGKPNFLDHVQFVQNGLPLPSSNPNNPPAAPQPVNATPVAGTPYAQALQNAFLLAPPHFQTTLCGLTAIYVNGPTTCSNLADCIGNSWGFRVWQPSPQTPETYIAITAGLWSLPPCTSGSPPPQSYVYHCFETDLLDAVFGSTPHFFQYSSANAAADNFDMTILAALAHEVAHVKWYQVMAPNGPGISGYNPNNFLCTSNPGTPGFFSYSWSPSVQRAPVWRVFLTLDKRNHGFGAPDVHKVPPQIRAIDAVVNAGNMTRAAAFLEELYRPAQPWASYFAAISPDEDFVETYKFYVLTNAQNVTSLNEGPLTSLAIPIAGVPHDIPGDYSAGNKPLLSNKTQCIAPVI
jgi:hypothetical protein